MWDVAGQDSLRSLWQHYYQNTKAVIFVVDSADKERMSLAKNELFKLVNDEELKDSTLLLLANKMDLEVMTAQEVALKMDFDSIKNPKKKYFGIVGTTGKGLK